CLQAIFCGPGRGDLNALLAQQTDDALPLDLVVLDDEQVLDLSVRSGANAGEGLVQDLLANGLLQPGKGTELFSLPRLVTDGDDVDGNVPWERFPLEAVQDNQAIHVRQADVEGDGHRTETPCQRQGRCPQGRDQRLESFLVSDVEQDVGKLRVAFDNQDD